MKAASLLMVLKRVWAFSPSADTKKLVLSGFNCIVEIFSFKDNDIKVGTLKSNSKIQVHKMTKYASVI